MLSGARLSAQKRGQECTLTEEWFQERLERGHCEVTGLPFSKPEMPRYERSPYQPSIDRKDRTKGYTPENCRLVVWMYNCAKGTWTDEDVLQLSIALYEMPTE